MFEALSVLGWASAILGAIGALYNLFAAGQVKLRARSSVVRAQRGPRRGEGAEAPLVTLLKPLHGDEPGLYANLESFCRQAYDQRVEFIFGVHDLSDPAVAHVRTLRRAYPALDIRLVADGRVWGENGKVSNLVNMERHIRGEFVVLSDSDIRVQPDYLRAVVAPLSDPSVGFVTCLYTGLSIATPSSRLAAMGIDYQFLPSVAAGLRLGMAKPCLGATIALRRTVLADIGVLFGWVISLPMITSSAAPSAALVIAACSLQARSRMYAPNELLASSGTMRFDG